MKQTALLFFLLISITCSSQICLIGKSVQEVKSFWAKKIPLKHIVIGQYSDGDKEQYLWIMADTTLGSPIFSATFDKVGKCKKHETVFKGDLLEDYVSLLNKNKQLVLKDDKWVSSKGYFYLIEEHPVLDQVFILVCERK